LFRHCVEIAKEHGCHNLFLNVFSFNTGAVAFYERMGMHEMLRRMELIL
jgi:ribosomal protein S18 acetylase RimI-like enzyme